MLSVRVGRDSDVHDEGGLVLEPPVLAVGERADPHAVGAWLLQGPRSEQHPLQVLIAQGEGRGRGRVYLQEGGAWVHDTLLGVGHQPDEVLAGGNAERQRQQLVLQGVGAQCALQVIGRAALQAEATGSRHRHSGEANALQGIYCMLQCKTEMVANGLCGKK